MAEVDVVTRPSGGGVGSAYDRRQHPRTSRGLAPQLPSVGAILIGESADETHSL
jgi:hypothetical protein